MPTDAPEPSVTPRPRRPVGIDPLADELIDIIRDNNAALLKEVQKFQATADNTAKWLVRGVLGGVSAFSLGVLALVIYMVSLIANQHGADVGAAAKATKDVVGIVTDTQTAAPAPTPAPPEVPDGG